MATDTAELQRLKEELETSELRYRRLFENARDGILLVDFDTGMVLDVNEFLINLLGYSKEEFLEKHLWDIGAFRDVAASKEHFKELQAKKYIRYENLPLVTKSGKSIPVEIISYAYKVDEKQTIQLIQCNVLDITHHKQTEELLSESERELKEAQRLGKLGNWTWDIAKDKITWSKEYYRIIGLDPLQPPPKYEEHLKVYTPESAARLDAAVKKEMKTGEPYELDLEIADPKGTCRWIAARSETIRDDKGKIIGLRGTAHNITERIQAEEALKESEEKFAKAFHSSPQALTITSIADGLLIEVNDSFTRIFGYSQEEVLGHTTLELGLWLTPEDRVKFINNLKKDGFVRSVELPLKTKNGSIVTIVISAEPISLAGKPCMLSTFYDITERKKAEEELKASEEKYSTLVEKGNDGVLIFSDNGIFRYVNSVICKMTGYTKEEILGTPFINYVSPEYQKMVAERYEQRIKGEEAPSRYEIAIIDKDGSKKQIDISAARIEYQGKPAVMAVVRDITERKKMEAEKAAQLKKMELLVKSMVGRELKMVDLKKQLKELQK